MIIQKDNNDPNGYAFEDALAKAQYMYPKPRNPHIHTILQHAQQIYDGELIERSICKQLSEFKPINMTNCKKYFEGMKPWEFLLKTKERKITKEMMRKNNGAWETYYEEKNVTEWEYMYYDIFHVPTLSIIECKTYDSDEGRKSHLQHIRENTWKYKNMDYFLIASNKDETSFEITDFLSLNDSNQFKNHDINEFININKNKYITTNPTIGD